MKKNLLALYALGLCFVLAASLAIVFSMLLYDLLELNFPELTLPARIHERHQSDELFLLSLGSEEGVLKKKQFSKARLSKLRKESYRAALLSEQRAAKQSLMRGAITIFVSSLLFWIHWRLARRYHN